MSGDGRMGNWVRQPLQWMHQLSTVLNGLKSKTKRLLGSREPLQILPYRSYGTPESLRFMGRVLQNKSIRSRPKDASLWKNLLNMYRRFESAQVPGAKVRISLADQQVEVIANREGYFQAEISVSCLLQPDCLWHQAGLELLEPQPPNSRPPVKATAIAIVPTSKTQFGVISDIDDTIVYTAATDFFRMIRVAYMGNARTRLPFQGVASFYQALHYGNHEQASNPIFYVSSSAWNMYDLFAEFLDLQQIPAGPLLLKDTVLSLGSLLRFDHVAHKREKIEPILRCYPSLPFILIGDSGQQDAEIYTQIAQDYEGQIAAIYIRNVSQQNSRRQEELRAIAQQARQVGTQFLVVTDTEMAAMHAAEQGWIKADALSAIAKAQTQAR
ncbi:MAG: App1 family protein [Almyronema sp.]